MRQGKWCLGRLFAALAIAALVQAFAAAADETAPIAAGPYVDPRGRFILSIPPGADSAGPTEKFDLSIRARSGYVINLQTAPAKPNLTLEAMRAKLEAKYLGDTKIWSQKLGEAYTKLAGLPAFDGLYRGARTRSRVVIARGRRTEFVFMFFSPPDLYDQLVQEFDNVLASFRPALAEAWEELAPPAPATPVAQAPRPMARQRFADPKFGFSIDYPADWMMRRPSEFSVIFSGAKDSPAYYSTVSIQNASPGGTAGAPKRAAGAVLADLKSQLASIPGGAAYLGERPYRYERNGLRLEGHEFLVTYTRGAQRFKQLTVIVPRPGGTVVHIWSYASPENRFQEHRAIAEAMLKSWTIEVPGG